jgi:hypothetical protein
VMMEDDAITTPDLKQVFAAAMPRSPSVRI